jgi:hypothetical protein
MAKVDRLIVWVDLEVGQRVVQLLAYQPYLRHALNE